MITSTGTSMCQTGIVVQITQCNYIPDNRFPQGLWSLLFRTLASKLTIIITSDFYGSRVSTFYRRNNMYTCMWEKREKISRWEIDKIWKVS